MGISKGLYNNILTLQTLTETADGVGGVTTAWEDIGSFKGRISPLSAQERLQQDKTVMGTTHRIYCDNMNVSPKNRIRWGTYYFEIIGITNPSEAYHHLEIDAREINVP